MASAFDKIKSKYSIRKIFSFLPMNNYIKAVYISKKLSNKLQITKETVKKFSDMKKIIKPHFNIEKYMSHFNENYHEDDIIDYDNKNNYIINSDEISELKESIFYGVLNTLSFNIPIVIGSKYWKLLLKNISNNRLEINPRMLQYLLDIGKETKEDIFKTLRLYKQNIKEISIDYFYDNYKLNFQNLNYVINIIALIFGSGIKEFNLSSQYDNVISKDNNNIKKISFNNINIPNYIDFYGKFLVQISRLLFNNDINKMNIDGIYLDSNSFDEIKFKDMGIFINNNVPKLKSLEIAGLGENINNYYILQNIFKHSTNLYYLDLSYSLCSFSFLNLALKEYKNPLKLLKLRIVYSVKNKIEWVILNKSISSLETFEIELISAENDKSNEKDETDDDYCNMNQLMTKINEMSKLKKLKLINNSSDYKKYIRRLSNKNIENLDIKLFGNSYNKSEYIADFQFLNQFQKIISLSIKKDENILHDKNEVEEDYDLKEKGLYILPKTLTSIKLINFELENSCLNQQDENLLSILLQFNENKLEQIQELILENCSFSESFFKQFIKSLQKMKFLKKISITNASLYPENKILYINIPLILERSPQLIELDLSNNQYNDKMLEYLLSKNIKEVLPKNLLSLRIFNPQIPITKKIYDKMFEYFGYLLDYENVVLKEEEKNEISPLFGLFLDDSVDSSDDEIDIEDRLFLNHIDPFLLNDSNDYDDFNDDYDDYDDYDEFSI